MMKQLVLAAALFGIFSTAAIADDRYATRPPVVLSPDLTAPWINQLGGGRVRPVVYQRPVVRQPQRGIFQRRVLRQAPQAAPQTVSAINPGIPSIRRPIEPQYLPQMVDYDTTEKPGTIVIDTNNRFLYLVMAPTTFRTRSDRFLRSSIRSASAATAASGIRRSG